MSIPFHGLRAAAALRPVFTVAVLGFVACGDRPVDPPADFLADGVSLALAEHRASTLSDIEFDVALDVPGELDAPIRGTVDARFRRSDASAWPLVLDFVEAPERVRAVAVNGTAADVDLLAEHIVIPAALLAADAENAVRIEFTAGDASLNRTDETLYTLFVPERARLALPLFDQPDIKARYALSLTIPEDWVAISNAHETGSSSADDGRRTVTFARSQPLPSYLFAFTAGLWQVETAERDGRTFRMLHRETDADVVARNRDEAFGQHAEALAWLEEYTGISYPFDTFDFVLTPTLAYGGMEHPGTVLYRAGSVNLPDAAPQALQLERANVIAHETSHMWFGNLVTMRWFNDVWMKEVFAQYYAAKIAEPKFPDMDHRLRFMMSNAVLAASVDRTGAANPIRQPLENLNEAGTMYGAIVYGKSPIVMAQLESRIGGDALREGIRAYLASNAYANAGWPALIEELDARTDEDLAAWSRVWVSEADRPTIRTGVGESSDGSTIVRVSQDDPAGRGRVWPQVLEVLVGHGTSFTPHTVSLGADPVELAVDGGRPDWVIPNGSGIEYGLFDVDDGTLAWLLENGGSLQPDLVRGAAWLIVDDALLEGRIPVSTFMDVVLRWVRSEENQLILQSQLGAMSTVFARYLDDDARADLAPTVEAALRSRMGPDDTPAVRRMAAQVLWGIAATPESLAWMRGLLSGETSIPGVPLAEPDRASLALVIARHGEPDWKEILDVQEAAITNPDRLTQFRYLRPTVDPDPAVRKAWFDGLGQLENRAVEPWASSGLGNLHHPSREDTAIELIRPGLDLLEEVQRTGSISFPDRWVAATMGGHSSAEALAEVDAWLEANPGLSPRLREKVLQARDGLARAVMIKAANAGGKSGE